MNKPFLDTKHKNFRLHYVPIFHKCLFHFFANMYHGTHFKSMLLVDHRLWVNIRNLPSNVIFSDSFKLNSLIDNILLKIFSSYLEFVLTFE
jgi:hypothetical protein